MMGVELLHHHLAITGAVLWLLCGFLMFKHLTRSVEASYPWVDNPTPPIMEAGLSILWPIALVLMFLVLLEDAYRWFVDIIDGGNGDPDY